MALLNAGYWPTTYWPSRYWEPNYWPKYGVPAVQPSTGFPLRHPPTRLKPRLPLDREVLILLKQYLELKLGEQND